MTAAPAGALAVATTLVALLPAFPAQAADVTVVAGVRVAPPACPIAPLDVAAFVDSLRVELASRSNAAGTTLVTLAIEPCDPGTTRVHVAVASDAGEAGAERDVGLEDIAFDARPRALALAVAELVRATTVAPAPPPPPAPPPAPPAPARPSVTPSVAADALAAFFPGRATTLWGGRLSVSLARARASLAVFGEAAAGAHDYDVGSVDLQSFGGGVTAGPRWVRGRLTVAPELVGALAWARIQGHADGPGVAMGAGSGLTAAVRARLAASVLVVRVATVRAFAEAGWMVRGFDATVDGARAAGLSGGTLVFGLGLGL